jgi:lipopolysaccharide transport system ATP-binding protein
VSALGSHVAIAFDGLGKRYRIGLAEERDDTLGGALGRQLAAPLRNLRRLRRLRRFEEGETRDDVIWALREVSFEVKRGEALGIVGRNGAGKSTLLKVLARITHPTTGSVRLRGRLASLLEVGTGFHPDLTGRENIFLNGTMLGMTRREIEGRFDEMVEFADLGTFIDTPVKRYSTGMHLRLGFAVAAHLEPDILLADEVLAVGDAEFQRRCLGKMREVAGGGRTVLFVSHNLGAVSSLCSRAIWLELGRLQMDGPVARVLTAYSDSVRGRERVDLSGRVDRRGDGRLRFTSVEFRTPDGEPTTSVAAGDDLLIVLEYASADGRPLRGVHLRIRFLTRLAARVGMIDTAQAGQLGELPPQGRVVCRVRALPLTQGEYIVALRARVRGQLADSVHQAAAFVVDATGFYPTGRYPGEDSGPLLLQHDWTLES